MAFDEQVRPSPLTDKVEICARAYQLLTEEVGFAPSDIIFDANILTVGTGMEEHNNYAVEFIEAVRQLKQLFPLPKLPAASATYRSASAATTRVVREAMNAAFLYHAIQAGLDMGIVNAGQLQVYEEIPKDLLEHVEDVLLNRRPDATERLMDFAKNVGREGQEPEQAAGLARGAGRGAAQACPGQRHPRLHRRGCGGGPAKIRAAACRSSKGR